MSTSIAAAPSIIDRVKRNLVDLKMPRALEIQRCAELNAAR